MEALSYNNIFPEYILYRGYVHQIFAITDSLYIVHSLHVHAGGLSFYAARFGAKSFNALPIWLGI